jgi:hypothetical protein
MTDPKPFRSPGFTRPEDTVPRINVHGCTLACTFHPEIDRYVFDMRRCVFDDGWEQYDTDQDASYFGVWVRLSTRETVTYAEGDITHVTAPTDEAFAAELASMAEFYGSPPPAFKVITGEGQLVEVTGSRPGEDGPSGSELLAEALKGDATSP